MHAATLRCGVPVDIRGAEQSGDVRWGRAGAPPLCSRFRGSLNTFVERDRHDALPAYLLGSQLLFGQVVVNSLLAGATLY